MRKYWLTTYTVVSRSVPTGTDYSSYVLAYSYEEACRIIAYRKLGERLETVEGTPVTAKLVMINPFTLFIRLNRTTRVVDRHRDIRNLMHMCCFLLHLNEKCGKPLPDVFSDVGLIHQLMHALLMPKAELNHDYYALGDVIKELANNHPEMFLTDDERRALK